MDKTAAPQGLQLRDIHLPDVPGYWPLAPGWWVLIVLFIIAAYFIFKAYNKIKKKKQLVAIMQSQLHTIHEDFRSNKDKHKLAVSVSDLLKRFVHFVLNDTSATSLTGEEWINYLNSKSQTDVFSQFKMPLTQAQYLKAPDFDVPSLVAAVKNYFPEAMNFKEKI